ncbi:alkaline phosphatase D family protein [Roseateles sp.]|uniref:alkaline phosphatase D family protein n=1 Tax=Roseateles sp. TaxID=1971397 RepID=UPI003BA80858
MSHNSSINSSQRRAFMRDVSVIGLAAPAVVRAATNSTPTSPFTHGVASGDPLADRVMLWTRVNPALGNSVTVLWDVASDEGFTQILRRGRALALAERDHTVKVDALGLPAGKKLYYRFIVNGQASRTGRTRTLANGSVAAVKLAVFSCSNYPAGYFNVYAEAAKMADLDAAVHLGDYIYEYARGGYASADAAQMGRESLPLTEVLSLNDYRQRYAQYRSDADLQDVHAALPFICVWDDHEIANDTWKDGAENHTPGTEGDFVIRRAAAMKAYHEWMPIRSDAARPELIFRSFKFGNLLDLHMLDTRALGRDKQLSYANYMGASGFNAAKFAADMGNPARQLLGSQQSQWLQGRLASSNATWQVLGQQVLMARMNIPAPLVLGQISFSDYVALLALAQSNPAALTDAQKAVLAQPAIPYNLDAWDGYSIAREVVLGTARSLNKNLVVLAGDTHNAWASDLHDYQGNQVGVEFATPGVSSPGFEEYFPKENPLAVAGGLEQIIGPLKYANTHQRGFMVVTATAQQCRCDWHYVSTVKSKTYETSIGRSLAVLPGAGARHLTEV